MLLGLGGLHSRGGGSMAPHKTQGVSAAKVLVTAAALETYCAAQQL